MSLMYCRINQYCNVIPDFPLYFSFAKHKPEWFYVYPKWWKDLFQIIALCILENETIKKRNLAIGRELYNFTRHVLGFPLKTPTKGYSKKCKKITKCWICKKVKKEYMRESLTPGHKICGACYQKIRRNKVKGRKYMHTVELIANAIKNYPDIYIPNKAEKGICCVTGIEGQTVRKKDILSGNFTNYDLLKSPESDRMGIEAAVTLKYRPERSSWFVNEKGFMRFDKNLFREMFLTGVKNSKYWAIYITTSYKKHGALVTKVNSCRNGKSKKFGWWRFEQLDVNASEGRKNKSWYKKISQALIEYKIGRSIIESLNCPPGLIKKFGIKNWIGFERWARDKYQSPLYKLCCYLLPSQKDLKDRENDN